MLSAADLDACQQALDKVGAAADLADEKAAGAGGWFSSLIGAESTAAAMKADAAATRNGFNVLSDKLTRWRLDPTVADHAAALDFIQSAGAFADVSQLMAAAKMLDASNAAVTIAEDTAKDAAKAAGAGLALGGLGYLTVLALGAGGLGLFAILRRSK